MPDRRSARIPKYRLLCSSTESCAVKWTTGSVTERRFVTATRGLHESSGLFSNNLRVHLVAPNLAVGTFTDEKQRSTCAFGTPTPRVSARRWADAAGH